MGKSILFVQQKGGAGKSTLLTQLAVHHAQAGARVALIDLDPQRSTATWFAERVRRLGDPGIELVEGAEWRAASDIRDTARRVDLVFVDAPGAAGILGGGAMRAADFGLIPCQPSMLDVWASKETLEMARKEKLAHALVLNRMPPRGRAAEAAAEALSGAGARLFETRIGARSAFTDAFMRGAGVTETAKSSKAAAEVKALAAELAKAIG
jgi:chromosome partitioning protein